MSGTSVWADDTPKGGYIPTEQIAVSVAEIVLVPIFGAVMVEQEKPFHAELQNGVWAVEGTTKFEKPVKGVVRITTGGPLRVDIDKYTGKILSAYWMK